MKASLTEIIVGIPVSSLGREQIIHQVIAWVSNARPTRTLMCVNPHSIVLSKRDREFARALQSADLVTADGAGILLASSLAEHLIRERTTGMDVFLGVCDGIQRLGGCRFFFLGSTADVLERIKKKLAEDFPKNVFAGAFVPSFSEKIGASESDRILEEIQKANPDILWVGMTAPKQEKWIFTHRDRLGVPVAIAVGAVFDFYAGTKRRAPAMLRRLGLEWLWRFANEPFRMWRRNLVSTPIFIATVLSDCLRKHKERT